MRSTWRGLYQTCKLQFLSLHVHASHLYLYLEHVQARVRILSYRNVHIIVLNLHVALPMKEGSRQRIETSGIVSIVSMQMRKSVGWMRRVRALDEGIQRGMSMQSR